MSKKTGEIRICYDQHRADYQWYAKVPLLSDESDPLFEKLLAQGSALEIKLEGPKLIKATRTIIAELERRGISTTNLRIKPYQ